MIIFQEPFWGYELTYGDGWTRRTVGDAEWFLPHSEPVEEPQDENLQGHLIIRAEWVYPAPQIEPLWNRHIGSMAGMIGAKNVSSVRWLLGGASGYEAEIVLPKKSNKRLWTGILQKDSVFLNFVVAHYLKDRDWFEPAVSKVISSLRIPQHIEAIQTNSKDVPIPPGYRHGDPTRVISDINDPGNWEAYRGDISIGALQAFYIREAVAFGWDIMGFVPFPSQEDDIGFAQLRMKKSGISCTLGLMPYGGDGIDIKSPANVVMKYNDHLSEGFFDH
ncbi:MAG: hypothetical protein MUO76_05780 [Anaerolineaceae bacterium]|nr:hypothetical protein [Anaerolineaceae bacterium]